MTKPRKCGVLSSCTAWGAALRSPQRVPSGYQFAARNAPKNRARNGPFKPLSRPHDTERDRRPLAGEAAPIAPAIIACRQPDNAWDLTLPFATPVVAGPTVPRLNSALLASLILPVAVEWESVELDGLSTGLAAAGPAPKEGLQQMHSPRQRQAGRG